MTSPHISFALRALASVHAQRSEHAAAGRDAREAVRLALTTDFLEEQADAYVDLAEVYERAGRHADAVEALQSATALYDDKRDITGATQARMRLDAVGK
jgi:tetratricopeptide (TPR) repeat protein